MKSFESFMASVESLRAKGGVDLSIAEDLSLAVMNLISLEEHFFFTAMKSGGATYLDTGAEVRNMRKKLLAELMPNHEGETWCASKHLLAASMRLIEVGNRFHVDGLRDKALESYKQAYRLYSIFWALKMKLVSVEKNPVASGSSGMSGDRLEDLVSKLADCCKE